MRTISCGCLAGVFALACSTAAFAQEPKSAPLAKQLAAALDAAKGDSVAAKDPSNAGVFIGALYVPGFELLLVSGQYSAPALIDQRLGAKQYRDVYIELNGTVTPATRVFIEDIGIDGLRAKRSDGTSIDTYEAAGKRTTFDEEWKKQKLTEDEYMKIFTAADDRYSQMLTILIAQLKKSS
jgi:hypothetical protein